MKRVLSMFFCVCLLSAMAAGSGRAEKLAPDVGPDAETVVREEADDASVSDVEGGDSEGTVRLESAQLDDKAEVDGVGGSLGSVEIRLTPTIRLQTVYDDNVDFKGFSDQELEAIAGVLLDVRGAGGSTLKSLSRMVGKDYLDHDELDRVDLYQTLSGRYVFGETLSAGLQVDLVKDHLVTSAAEESAIITEATSRSIWAVAPDVYWQFGEKDAASLELGRERVNQDRDQDADYTTDVASLSWAHNMTKRLSVITTAMVMNTDYSIPISKTKGSQFSSIGFLGAKYAFTEQMGLSFNGGFGVTSSDYTFSDVGKEDATSETWLANGEFYMNLERLRLTFGLERNIQPLFSGENSIRDRGRIRLRYLVTELFDIGLTSTYTISKTEGLVSEKKHSEGIFSELSANYVIEKDVVLRFGMNYNKITNVIHPSTKTRFRVWAGVTVGFPMLF